MTDREMFSEPKRGWRKGGVGDKCEGRRRTVKGGACKAGQGGELVRAAAGQGGHQGGKKGRRWVWLQDPILRVTISGKNSFHKARQQHGFGGCR